VTGTPATIQLPLLPLKNVVLFPHMIVPLYVGRKRSIHALEAAMAQGKQVFVCTQRQADCEDPKEEDLYRVGVIGEVVQMLKLPDSTIKVLIEGSSRAVIERFIEGEPHLRVEVALLEEDFLPSPELEGLMRGVVDLFDRYVELDKKVPPEVNLTVRGVEDAGRMADIVASNLGIGVTDKQDVLETFQMNARLEKLSGVLEEPLTVAPPEQPVRLRHAQGALRFDAVDFAYRERPILTDLDLDIPGGQTLAVVGMTGAGKTTIARLAARFWDPTAGHVT